MSGRAQILLPPLDREGRAEGAGWGAPADAFVWNAEGAPPQFALRTAPPSRGSKAAGYAEAFSKSGESAP